MGFEIIDANTVFGPWPIVRAEMPIERLLKAMKNHGVSKSIAVSTVGVLHNSGDGNNETLRLCSEQGGAVMPAATIDPRGYFGAKGLASKLADAGFKMFRFFPLLQDWPLDLSSFCDLLDEIEPSGLPVMIQARETGCPSALRRILDNRAITFILEGISFENMAETVSVMRKYPSTMCDTRGLRVPGALRFLVDQVGADRVIFGSGCLRSSLAAALGYVMDADISDDAKAAVLAGNIKRLLGEG
ncbi:MAG: amidohydrolase family protein [Armatimonadetes bacterium]|jgi:predicted TIM-barrel fold metal-dependent hydrolase|nr:amidohydrolase family protein [Armatimonadota bacterium]